MTRILEEYDYKKFDSLFSNTPGNENKHYFGPIQPTIFSLGNRMVFPLSNILKYSFRYKHKKGIQDLEKAVWYTRLQILDHDSFVIPTFIRKRITDKQYLEANPQFNEMQIKVSRKTYLYNITANMHLLNEVQDTLIEYLANYDQYER